MFVSSESALQIPAEMVYYGMTKTAQLAVARGLAETTVGTGITVNSVRRQRPRLGAERRGPARGRRRRALHRVSRALTQRKAAE